MLPKRFQQDPDNVPLGQITDLSLGLIASIEAYRLIPSSLLLAVVGANARWAQHHLHKLFHHDYVKRFSLENFGRSREMIYYLDNPKALRELVHRTGVDEASLDKNRLARNRERPYMDFNDADPKKREAVLSRLNTLDHELAISRFHAMVELACQGSNGATKLTRWLQGRPAHRYVEAPEMIYNRQEEIWEEGIQTEILPWRPDAFFTLVFANPAEKEVELGFAYEYQKTTATEVERLLRKYRAHYQFVIQDKHSEHFGIKRIRAVLTESPDSDRANYLRRLTRNPIVSNKPSPLFLFTTSEFFTKLDEIQQGQRKRKVPRFWHKPQTVFEPHWYTPVDNTPVSLYDY